jgi:hypothetical protein
MNDEMRRKFFSDYPGHDINPDIQDMLHDEEPPFLARTEAEDALFSGLPGDDLSGHLLGPHTNNPYLKNSYSELKEMLEEGGLDREQEVQVQSALDQHRRHHAHPYDPPVDATAPR